MSLERNDESDTGSLIPAHGNSPKRPRLIGVPPIDDEAVGYAVHSLLGEIDEKNEEPVFES